MKTVMLGELITQAKVRRAGAEMFPVLSMTMHDGLVDQSQKFKKRIASEDVSDYKVIERGQPVVGFPIDEGVLDFQHRYDAAIVSPAYGVWDVNGAAVERDYLGRFLRSPRALSYYKAKLRGSTARRRSLPSEIFLALQIPLPSLAEQRRVVAILDHVESLRVKRSRNNDNWNELASSTFYEMFGDPVVNPRGWPTGKLADQVSDMQYGPRFYNESYSADGMRIVRITDLNQNGTLDFQTMPRMSVTAHDEHKYRLSSGDIIFARTGATVGKLAVIREQDPPCIAGAYFIRIQLKEAVEPDYAAAVLRSRSIQSIIVGGSHQSAQQNFSGPGLRALPFPVPPIELQRQFAAVLAEQAKAQAPISRSTQDLDRLFASLQSRAFRGEL